LGEDGARHRETARRSLARSFHSSHLPRPCGTRRRHRHRRWRAGRALWEHGAPARRRGESEWSSRSRFRPLFTCNAKRTPRCRTSTARTHHHGKRRWAAELTAHIAVPGSESARRPCRHAPREGREAAPPEFGQRRAAGARRFHAPQPPPTRPHLPHTHWLRGQETTLVLPQWQHARTLRTPHTHARFLSFSLSPPPTPPPRPPRSWPASQLAPPRTRPSWRSRRSPGTRLRPASGRTTR